MRALLSNEQHSRLFDVEHIHDEEHGFVLLDTVKKHKPGSVSKK